MVNPNEAWIVQLGFESEIIKECKKASGWLVCERNMELTDLKGISLAVLDTEEQLKEFLQMYLKPEYFLCFLNKTSKCVDDVSPPFHQFRPMQSYELIEIKDKCIYSLAYVCDLNTRTDKTGPCMGVSTFQGLVDEILFKIGKSPKYGA